MFCSECGSKIPDNARFCPFCGEVLKKSEPTSIDKIIHQSPLVESDFKLSLGGDDNHITTSLHLRREISLLIKNTSSLPKYQIELKLSGPPQVYIPEHVKVIRVIGSHITEKVSFTIAPRELGSFTLKAILLHKSGQSIELPIYLKVESSKIPHPDSYEPLPKSSGGDAFIAVAIVLGIIALILVGSGISTVFSSPSIGITMIVIGVIIFTIATQGKCFLCFLGCDGCDCDGCDCDC